MQTCYILLMAVATLLAGIEAATISDNIQATKLTSTQEVEALNAVHANGNNQRFLRSRTANGKTEERSTINMATIDESVKDVLGSLKSVKVVDDNFSTKKKDLFEKIIQTQKLKEDTLSRQQGKDKVNLEVLLSFFFWDKLKKFDKNEIANAIQKKRNIS